MSITDRFIADYTKELEHYQNLARIAASKIEDELLSRGIRAIVTYRAKRPDRLKAKLLKRDIKKRYCSAREISDDIVDLAGVRISLYFPSDRNLMDEIISDLFNVVKTKSFPNETHNPKYEKRFSGYWATHYRVKLFRKKKGEAQALQRKYLNTIIEVQVASVLMHSWSEVEHDLVYKPLSGELSREELAILDEINGLVLSGEIALERLQFAMSERTKRKNEIKDQYELTNYLLSVLNKGATSKIKLGETQLLDNFLNTIKKLDINELNDYVSKVNTEQSETVTDQILEMMMTEEWDKKDGNFREYFKKLQISEPRISDFERFLKCWGIMEMVVKEVLGKTSSDKFTIPDFRILKENHILNAKETESLSKMRHLRNRLLHGIDTPSESILQDNYHMLKGVIDKILVKVPESERKNTLQTKLNSL